MTKIFYTFLVVVTILLTAGCNSNKQKTNTEKDGSSCESQSCCSSKTSTTTIDTSKVNVVYFHATRRCATCEAVEKVTKETLAKYFDTTVPFHSINREVEKELAKKYEVEWQTLLIMKGDQIKNLTNEAFLNARTKPEKLESLIKSTIESMS